MSKIGILAGGGKLPLSIGENLFNKGNNIIYFCIRPFIEDSDYKDHNIKFIKLDSLSKIVKLLKEHHIEKIIMDGFVKRTSLLLVF